MMVGCVSKAWELLVISTLLNSRDNFTNPVRRSVSDCTPKLDSASLLRPQIHTLPRHVDWLQSRQLCDATAYAWNTIFDGSNSYSVNSILSGRSSKRL